MYMSEFLNPFWAMDSFENMMVCIVAMNKYLPECLAAKTANIYYLTQLLKVKNLKET